MKILFIVIGILGIFSSCTSRKERLAEGEESILNEYEVEKNIFRPNSFPLKGETLMVQRVQVQKPFAYHRKKGK